MKKEDKDLLLKDLCARLPYGVKVHINSPIEEQNSMELFDVNLDGEHIGVGNEKWAFKAIPIIDDEDEAKVVKPYLRSMSSMTEEEEKEFVDICTDIAKDRIHFVMDGSIDSNYMLEKFDWLNKNHFDYRGLIEKGLAITVTEKNNPYNE